MKKGFTLLELLIVIIIIGLLAAIGIVQYGKAVGNAKNAEAKTTLGEMRKAAMAYYSLNGSYPSALPITVDLDSDNTVDVSFTAPTGGSFTYTAASGDGVATKVGSPAGVSNWTIDFSSGQLTSS